MLTIDKKINMIFKKLFHALVIIFNNENEELSIIRYRISQELNITEKTADSHIRKLLEFKIIEKKKKESKKILIVPEAIKSNIYKYIIQIIPGIYRPLIEKIVLKNYKKIKFDEKYFLALEKFIKDLEKQIVSFIKNEFPAYIIEKSFLTKLHQEFSSFYQEKITESVLF
jgi:hypothetical protein